MLKGRGRFDDYLAKIGFKQRFYRENCVADYQEMVKRMISKPEPDFVWFRCVTPSFDNSARKSKGAVVLHDSTPEKYEAWLREVIRREHKKTHSIERIVFINAWNEWGEGNHLEPDLKWKKAYLEATAEAINGNK